MNNLVVEYFNFGGGRDRACVERTLRNSISHKKSVVLHMTSDVYENPNRFKWYSYCSTLEQLLDETAILTPRIVHVMVKPPPSFDLKMDTSHENYINSRFQEFTAALPISRFKTIREHAGNLVILDLDAAVANMVKEKGYKGIFTGQKTGWMNERITKFGLAAISNAIIRSIPLIMAMNSGNDIRKFSAKHYQPYGGESPQTAQEILKSIRTQEGQEKKVEQKFASKKGANKGNNFRGKGRGKIHPVHPRGCMCHSCQWSGGRGRGVGRGGWHQPRADLHPYSNPYGHFGPGPRR